MKKSLFSVAVLILAFLAGSCQKQEIAGLGGDSTVKFTVNTGEMVTKADIADGTNVDILYYQIFGSDLNASPLGNGHVGKTTDKHFNVELKLVADQKYNIIFWAQVDGYDHYDISDLRNVGIKDLDEIDANDETRAAFFKLYSFETANGVVIDEDIWLKRPFAQINVGATTKETDLNLVDGGLKVLKSNMTLSNAATSFNTVTGKGEGSEEITFELNVTPNGTKDQTEKLLEVNDENYYWLAMNYLIVEGNESTVTSVDFDVETNVGTVQHTVSNVPVKENHRTNILGNVLTTEAKFEIIVDERFDGEYYGPEFLKAPAYDAATSTYTVVEKLELLWVVDQVNNKSNTFKNKTVKIAADIDLGGMSWTPIAATGKFEGTFEGAALTRSEITYPTISNFTVKTEGRASAGFFASCLGYIRNITLADVTVEGHYKTGALVGDGLCSKIENCHVVRATVVSTPYEKDDANNVGGLVGYLSAEPTAYVKNSSVKESEVTAYRKVGGLVGAANGASVVSDNTVEGVTVTADMTAEYKEVKAAEAGEFVGYKHANATLENNTAKDVEVIVLADSVADIMASKEEDHFSLVDGEYTLSENLTIDGAISVENGNEAVINAGGNDVVAGSPSYYGFRVVGNESSLVINDADIDSKGGGIGVADGAKAVFNSGSVAVNTTSTSGRYVFYAEGEGSEITINGGTFSFSKTLNQKRAYIYAGAGTTVYVNGGTFGKASTRSGYTAGILGEGTVIITGGTFGFDPTPWVADGHVAEKDGENWVVSKITDYVVSNGVHKVYNANGLAKWAYVVNNVDQTAGLELMNDIALPAMTIEADDANETYKFSNTPITVNDGVPSGSNWFPAGTDDGEYAFFGIADGNGYTISGLRINVDHNGYIGFIGCADAGNDQSAEREKVMIKDFNFEDAVIYSPNAGTTGTVVAYARNIKGIENCHVYDSQISAGKITGAICGLLYTRASYNKVLMYNCSTDANTTVTGTYNVGGIAGYNYGSVIRYCNNAAEINGIATVGGIAGYSRDYHDNLSAYIIGCGNSGNITASESTAAGIVGHDLKDNNHIGSEMGIIACYSTASSVSAPKSAALICANSTHVVLHYASWAIKTSSVSKLFEAESIACYSFASATSITQTEIDAMNAAIADYNVGRSNDDQGYCPYTWTLANGMPVLQ